MKKGIFAAVLSLLAMSFAAEAQNSFGFSYIPGLNAYGSHAIGVEYRHDFPGMTTIDVRGYYRTNYGGSDFEGLYEWNFPIFDFLKAYAGAGTHFGPIPDSTSSRDNVMGYGFSAAAGAQYEFPTIPLAISLDWNPQVTWKTSYTGATFDLGRPAVAVKFTF